MTAETNRTSYLEMAALGFARGAIPFPIEHPLERMKIEAQAHPQKTTRQAVTNLWQSQGLKGFYAGSRANAVRRVGREIYIWPVMLSFNRVWKRVVPEDMNPSNLTTNMGTGLSMAGVQATFTLPLERLLIEKTVHGGYRPFFEKMRASKRLIIYEGFQTTLIRHALTWNLFFISSHISSGVFKRVNPDSAHPYLSFVCTSMLTSTLVVSTGYPMEFIRNRILMEPGVLSNGTLNGIGTIFSRYKWRKLYTGVPVVLFHNCIQTLIVQGLVNRINKT